MQLGPVVDSEVGVVVVTHRARHHLVHCLPPLLRSALRPRVLVVNSSSNDGTVKMARDLGAEILVVPRDEFNHGLTRERARRHLGTAVVVMLTPDAYPACDDLVLELTAPVRSGRAAAAFGRQLPREGADIIERFGRAFNYPAALAANGCATPQHVFSNACAAWSSEVLDEIGGFPATLVSEETIAATRLLALGHRIAYVADAQVRHSHDYGLAAEFRRYFDIGWTRGRFAQLLLADRAEARRWRQFAARLVAHVARHDPARLPRAIASLAARLLGYRTGVMGRRLPPAVAALLSGQDYFWSSRAYRSGLPDALPG
jgi:rhamnosyltransferase